MKIYCGWCNEFLGEKEPFENESETHTICPPCMEKEIKRYTIKDVLIETLKTTTSVDVIESVWNIVKGGI